MVQIIKTNDQLTCMMPARLDTAACLSFQDNLLKRVAEEKMPVVFDMKDVTFVSSMFIRICLQVYKHAGASRFQVVNLSPDVKKVFKIAGLDQQLKIG